MHMCSKHHACPYTLLSPYISGVATPGPTRAQARAKLVCALVAKAQIPAINSWVGWEKDRYLKFWVTGPTRCPGNFTSLDTPLPYIPWPLHSCKGCPFTAVFTTLYSTCRVVATWRKIQNVQSTGWAKWATLLVIIIIILHVPIMLFKIPSLPSIMPSMH